MDVRYLIFLVPFICVIIFVYIFMVDKRLDNKKSVLNEKKKYNEDVLDEEAFNNEIKNLLLQIKEQLDNTETLYDLSDQCSRFYSGSATGDPVIDSILNYKSSLCEIHNIEFKIDVASVKQNPLSEKDTISLIGNLLDNAIEAAGQSKSRTITFLIREIKGQWIIRVVNSKKEDVKPLENNMVTTKIDSNNHGIGTKIIDRIIKKNKGYIRRNDSGSFFEVYMGIPVSKKHLE